MAGNPGGGGWGGGPFGPPGGGQPPGGGGFGPPGGGAPGGFGPPGGGAPGGFGPPGGGAPGGFGPPGGGAPGGFGPPGGGAPGGFGPPGGGAPGGFGPPGGGGFGPPGGGQPPGGFGPPGGGGFGPPGGGAPGGFGPPGGGAPGGFGPPGGGYGAPGGFAPQGQPMGGYGAPGGFNQMPPQRSSKSGLFVGIGVGVVAILCVVGVVLAKQAHDKEQATYGALKTVCSGQGVAAARMYTPTGLPHRVVGISRSTAGGEWSIRQSLIPVGRRSPDVAGTDIVMCFEPVVEQQQGTCDTWRTRNGIRVPGSTRNFPRVQLFQPVRLVSAQTGVTLNQGTLVGGAPPSCNVSFGTPTASNFRGSTPDDDEVNTYLAPLLGN